MNPRRGEGLRLPLSRILIAAASTLLPLAASTGQEPGGVAVVTVSSAAAYGDAVEGIRETLGAPLTLLQLAEEEEGDRPVLASLKSLRPDLVIPLGDRATRLVADRMPGVTIVFGLCARAPRAASNRSRITGVLLDVPADRQLAVFRAAVPSLARVGVIYDPARSADLVARIATAAQAAGIDLYTQRVSSAEEVPAAFRTIAAAVDGILMIPDETVVSRASFDYMLLKSLERRVPLMVFSEPMVRAGGLLALAADSRPIGRQVGELAATVLRSGRMKLPSVEIPRLLSLTINASSASLLGLTLSRDLLDNAARVYGEGRK